MYIKLLIVLDSFPSGEDHNSTDLISFSDVMETRRYNIFTEEYFNNKLEIFFFKVNFEKEITNPPFAKPIQNIAFSLPCKTDFFPYFSLFKIISCPNVLKYINLQNLFSFCEKLRYRKLIYRNFTTFRYQKIFIKIRAQ